MEKSEKERRGLLTNLMSWVGSLAIALVASVSGLFKAIYIVSKATGLQYTEIVGKIVDTRKYVITKFISYLLYIFVPIFFILAPVGFAVLVAAVFVVVDQTLAYREPVLPAFADPANNELKIGAKGALLFKASHYQIERMMDRFPFWSANDPVLYPTHYWDNSRNTQEGVWWATSQLVDILSDRITRYGTGQPQHPLTLEAFKKFHFGPDEWNWWITDSEGYFNDAIENLKEFESRAITNSDLVNIRTDDLEAILNGIKDRVLGEPYGRLTARSSEIKWTELDDIVKFSRGAAIVARDELVVLRSAFTEELSKGGLDNLDAAIDSLDAIINFHPWWTWRGDGDSMFADHRAKLSRYYSEVFRRIEDLASSLKI